MLRALRAFLTFPKTPAPVLQVLKPREEVFTPEATALYALLEKRAQLREGFKKALAETHCSRCGKEFLEVELCMVGETYMGEGKRYHRTCVTPAR